MNSHHRCFVQLDPEDTTALSRGAALLWGPLYLREGGWSALERS